MKSPVATCSEGPEWKMFDERFVSLDSASFRSLRRLSSRSVLDSAECSSDTDRSESDFRSAKAEGNEREDFRRTNENDVRTDSKDVSMVDQGKVVGPIAGCCCQFNR